MISKAGAMPLPVTPAVGRFTMSNMEIAVQILGILIIVLLAYRMAIAYIKVITIILNDLWFNTKIEKWTIGKTTNVYNPWDK
jgi:hypothetical protein